MCNEAYRLLAFYKLNPEDFIIKAGKIINNQKADMIIEHITYNRLEKSYSADIFMLANLHGRQGRKRHARRPQSVQLCDLRFR